MNKSKKLYITVAIISPIAITLFVLLIRNAIGESTLLIASALFGFSVGGWIIVAVYRARQLSQKIKRDDRKQSVDTIKTRKKAEIFEKTISIILCVYAIIYFTIESLNGWAVDKVLLSVLLLLVSGSHFIFLWLSKDY